MHIRIVLLTNSLQVSIMCHRPIYTWTSRTESSYVPLSMLVWRPMLREHFAQSGNIKCMQTHFSNQHLLRVSSNAVTSDLPARKTTDSEKTGDEKMACFQSCLALYAQVRNYGIISK